MKKKTFGIGLGSVVLLSKALTPSAMAACSNTAPPSNTAATCTGSGLAVVVAQTGSTGMRWVWWFRAVLVPCSACCAGRTRSDCRLIPRDSRHPGIGKAAENLPD